MISLLMLAVAAADPVTYVLAVGNNAVPKEAREPQLETLQYSDDDAVSVAELAEHFAQDITLLSELDAVSQRRYPQWTERSRPPTLVELDRAVQRIRARIATSADRDAVVIVFFSGHGSATKDGEPFLALQDGPLTQKKLYERVLQPLDGARAVHLLVDACNAESVVRPRGGVRDVDGHPTTLQPRELARTIEASTLARFGNVGAIVATTAGRSAHEWTRLERGVFTHELLSGLRGAADVNGDLRVEYSEMHAFLTSANREIQDPKARVDVIAEPPKGNARSALVDLRRLTNVAWLDGTAAAKWGHFFLEDGRGVRLADAHLEARSTFRMAVPIDAEIFVRQAGGEAMIRGRAGETIDAASVRFSTSGTKARGAIALDLERGLFAAAYGPTYYRGFVDAKGDVPVTFETTRAMNVDAERSRAPSIVMWTTAGAATVAAAVFGGLALGAADEFKRTDLQAPAEAARQRYNTMSIGFYTSLAVAGGTAVLGFALYPWAKVAVVPTANGISATVSGKF